MPIFHAVAKLLNRVPHQRIALLIGIAAAIVGAVFGLLAGASAVSHIRRIFGMDSGFRPTPDLGAGDDPALTVGDRLIVLRDRDRSAATGG